MKKLLFLIAISSFLFSCRAKYSEEIKKTLVLRVIPEGKARAMKERVKTMTGRVPKKFKFDMELYANLLKIRDDVYIVPVIYGPDDEKEYREAWGLSATDPAGAVNGYSSFIIQVGTNTDFYQFTQICPPPEMCME